MPQNVELSYPKKSENVRPHSNNSIENTTPLWSIQTHTTLHRTKGEPKVKRLKWLTCNFVRCQLRVIGLAVGKERWLSGVLFRGLPLWVSLVSRGFQCVRWAEKLKLLSSVFMGSLSSYELFIFPRLEGVIHNSRFSNSKYSLFIFF